MKTASVTGRALVILLIIIICAGSYGCAGYRVLSGYDMPVTDKYSYYIRGEKLMFRAEKISNENGVMTGRMMMDDGIVPGKRIIVFVASDKLMVINPDMTFSIPLQDISRVEMLQTSPQLSIAFAMGSLLVILFAVSALTFRFNPWDF